MDNLHYAPAAFESIYDELKEDAFKYCESDSILTNVFFWWNKNDEDKRLFRELCKKYNRLSLVDSGGFQLITGSVKESKFDPKKIFNIQTEVADVGFILDFPLVKMSKDADGKKSMSIITKDSEVDERVEVTRKNIDAVRGLDRKDMKYYFVVHGGFIDHYDKWISCLHEKELFDGITLKTKNLYQLFCSFFASYHLGFKRYHALGTSSLPSVIILAYLLAKCKDYGKEIEILTYDSTSPLQHAIYKRALFEVTYTRIYRAHLTNSKLTKLGCGCPVCVHLGDGAVEQFNKTYGWLIIHNINMAVRFNKFVSALVDDKKLFLEFVHTYFPKLNKFLKIVDLVFEEVATGKEFCKIYDDLDIGIRHYVESLVDLEEEVTQSTWDSLLTTSTKKEE